MNRISRLISRAEDSLFNGNGHARRRPPGRQGRGRRARYVVTRAELAPCTCPDFCERDHEND